MAEEYARRKRYTGAVKEPFETVIRNVHLLIAAGISVIVRLNVDENNLGEIYRVVDFLNEAFSGVQPEKLRVSAHSLYGQPGESLDTCQAGVGVDTLEARVLEINDYIQRHGLAAQSLRELLMLKSHYCMATAPECNVLIDAAGRLFACESMPEDMRYGDVKSGIDPQAWSRVAAPYRVREECRRCMFLPQCTEFDRCPNRMGYDDCQRQEKRKLESELRFAYAMYQDQKRQKQQVAEAAEPKEASDVSD